MSERTHNHRCHCDLIVRELASKSPAHMFVQHTLSQAGLLGNPVSGKGRGLRMPVIGSVLQKVDSGHASVIDYMAWGAQ